METPTIKFQNLNDGEILLKVLKYYDIDLEIVGANTKIICPFHADINPSMLIDLENGKFFCFGCNIKGDATTFVKKAENLSDMQAALKLRKILKSNKVKKIEYSGFKIKKKMPKKVMFEKALDYYSGLKTIKWEKLKSKEYEFIFEELKKVCRYMLQRGFDKKTLSKCKAKYTYNNSYPIIFPMFDNGEFKGYVCRTNNPDIEKKRKYLYNEGFRRSETLVGDYGSKKYVIVVEGYMDRLKFLQFGETNVIAILGWKMSDIQIQKLKKEGIEEIISALDNDESGRKGTKYLEKHFKVTRFSFLKGIKDPGEMNEESFKKMLNKTMKKRREKNGISR